MAIHEEDVVGNANNYVSATCNGWIDLIQYSTSGYQAYPRQDTSVRCNIFNTPHDWSIYNAISNGANQDSLWHTLT